MSSGIDGGGGARHLPPMRLGLGGFTLLCCFGCGSPLETDMPNSAACGDIGRALLDVCGGVEASTGVRLYDYLNCNIVPGCPGGNVETSDVEDCVARIIAQKGSPDDGKPQVLACRDALAVECEIARTDCGDAETSPAGGVLGFWEACSRLGTKLGDACLLTDDVRAAIDSQGGGDVAVVATLTAEARLDACAELLGCGRVAAFSESDLTLLLDDLDPGDCSAARLSVTTAQIDRAFCSPAVSRTVVP